MRHEFEFKIEELENLSLPDMCVVCEAPSPGTTVEIAQGWLDRKRISDKVFQSRRLTFPCCSGCRSKALWSRVVSGLMTVLAGLLALALGYLFTELFPTVWDGWTGYLVVLFCVVVGVLVTQSLYTPYAVLVQTLSRVTLTIRSEAFCKEFEDKNAEILGLD